MSKEKSAEDKALAEAWEQHEVEGAKDTPKCSSREGLINELNEIIEENHGENKIVTGEELFSDLGLDSFGATMFMLELQERYSYFGDDIQQGEDPFMSIDWKNLTVKDILDKICS